MTSGSLASAAQVTCLSYSPDGAHLAVGDSNRRVTVFTVGQGDGGYAKVRRFGREIQIGQLV